MKALFLILFSSLKWGKIVTSAGDRGGPCGAPACEGVAAPENVAYYGATLQTKFEYGGAYLALAALLAVMTYDVHEILTQFHRPGLFKTSRPACGLSP